jgi:hypothetical protein
MADDGLDLKELARPTLVVQQETRKHKPKSRGRKKKEPRKERR